MSKRLTSCVIVLLVVCGVVTPTRSADVAFVPISASGSHSISGNTIALFGGGQRVVLELRVSNWDPEHDGTPLLHSANVTIDGATYHNGASPSDIAPALVSCPSLDFMGRAVCEAAFGEFGSTCSTYVYGCPTSLCCVPLYFNTTRPDWIFQGMNAVAGVDTSSAPSSLD